AATTRARSGSVGAIGEAGASGGTSAGRGRRVRLEFPGVGASAGWPFPPGALVTNPVGWSHSANLSPAGRAARHLVARRTRRPAGTTPIARPRDGRDPAYPPSRPPLPRRRRPRGDR